MQEIKSYWLICPNWTEVRRFTMKKNNRDKFNEYMFIDSGLVKGVYGDKPPLMTRRREIKIDDARKEWKLLVSEGWQETKPKW